MVQFETEDQDSLNYKIMKKLFKILKMNQQIKQILNNYLPTFCRVSNTYSFALLCQAKLRHHETPFKLSYEYSLVIHLSNKCTNCRLFPKLLFVKYWWKDIDGRDSYEE